MIFYSCIPQSFLSFSFAPHQTFFSIPISFFSLPKLPPISSAFPAPPSPFSAPLSFSCFPLNPLSFSQTTPFLSTSFLCFPAFFSSTPPSFFIDIRTLSSSKLSLLIFFSFSTFIIFLFILSFSPLLLSFSLR